MDARRPEEAARGSGGPPTHHAPGRRGSGLALRPLVRDGPVPRPYGVAQRPGGGCRRGPPGGADQLTLAITVMPFAGIAFLWFVGVIRDRLGELEDRFFASVMFGSALLFLAMLFVAMAFAGGILVAAGGAFDPIDEKIVRFGREVMFQISNVYALRMAGVFMISLGDHLVADRHHASLGRPRHLSRGAGAASRDVAHRVGVLGVPGLGVHDQRPDPDRLLPAATSDGLKPVLPEPRELKANVRRRLQ